MKTIKAINKQFILTGFEFDDLSEEAKEKVISDYINFLLETIPYEDMTGNLKKAVDEAEKMRTPWFTGNYVYDYCKDEIIEEIKLNNYLFTKSGELLPLTYRTKENKIIKTTFDFFGEELQVNLI